MATQIASLFSLLSLRDDMTPALEKSKRGLADVGGAIDRVGGGLTRLGGAMTAVGAPAAAGFAIAVQSATRFDETMTGIQTLLGSTEEEMSMLSAEILAMGGHTRAGPQAVAEAFNEIVGGVQDATTHMDILEASIAASEATGGSLTATTSGLVSIMNSYGFAADRASFVSDVLVSTWGDGVGSMDQFVAAMGPAAGLAYDVGISIEELGAATAFLTSTGGTAGQSVTQLTAVMTAFLKPNSAMTEALAGMGYESGAAALQSLGLAGSIQALSESVGGSTDEMAQALGSTEALGGAVGLLNERAGEFTEDFIAGLNGVTETARGVQMDSAAAQFDLLKSHMDGLAITVGQALLPVLTEMVPEIINIIDRTLEWVQGNPELVTQIAMITGGLVILGPIIAGVGMVLSGIGTIITTVTGGLALAKAGVAALSGTMLGSIAAILAVGVAIAGVISKIHEFNQLTNQAASFAHDALGARLASGQVTQQQLYDQAFGATAAQFGGGFGGDLMARLFAGNIASGVNTGQFNVVNVGQRDVGGPGTAGMPYLIGKPQVGEELFVPSGNGTFIPDFASMMAKSNGGGVQIQSMTINASTHEGGREAARGFKEEMDELLRARG